MSYLFRLVILGTAVCIVLVHFVLLRKSKPRRGAVLILRGQHHPYIRHPLPDFYAGRRRRRNSSCANKYDRQLTKALKRSDQFIVEKLLRSAEYNRTITYEDDSAFPRTAVNDLFPYSAFLITRDEEWRVDIIALVPTDEGRLNKIQQKTTCYIDLKTRTFSTTVTFNIVAEHMAPHYSTAFVSCRYPSREKSVAVRVALGTTGTKTDLRWLKVHNPSPNSLSIRNGEKVLLTLCVGPLYGGYSRMSQIVEFFAYYSIMGVAHYRVYLGNVSKEVAALLNLVKLRGNLSISFHLWNVDVNSTRVAHHGQIAAIQDCIYRSKTTSEYTVHADFDEYLVPNNSSTLEDMVIRFEKEIGKDKLGSLVAQNRFFCFEYPPIQSALWQIPLMLSRALVARERTPWEHHIRSKYITSTSATIVGGVHRVVEATNGSVHVNLSVTTLAVNHYRRCCGLVNENAEKALVPDEPDQPDIVRDYGLYVLGMRILASPVMRAIETLG
ncbi:hypothetical protein HPB52_008712 [Rhipicephalus sanguineus]|uniref:Glycosyltransferase family 92 protein n=1 Tax=Rhipicephalus sanguineus TaxID=34632 RepID=A0A9D4PIG9_RHISA|nr:hypothetical protein HPB52_008712 [Rhipicephalus sanguineus]